MIVQMRVPSLQVILCAIKKYNREDYVVTWENAYIMMLNENIKSHLCHECNCKNYMCTWTKIERNTKRKNE